MTERSSPDSARIRRLIETVDNYGFSCEAGPLEKCGEWKALKRELETILDDLVELEDGHSTLDRLSVSRTEEGVPLAICERVNLLAARAPAQGAPIMQAAEKAAKTVEGWSDAKRDYAQRLMGDTPPQAAREAVIEECAKMADGWLAQHGKNEIQYTSAREYACDAVADIADAIRSLSRPQCSEG